LRPVDHIPPIVAMQTRRKSLNLGDMGVIAPKRHLASTQTVLETDEPPVKKSKWSHSGNSPPTTGLMSPPRTTTVIRIKEEQKPKTTISELSPPPSPVLGNGHKVDTEGIHDDIVVGAIQQLEKTGNRPHLVKELAAVLATKLHSVEKYDIPPNGSHHEPLLTLPHRSANPTALISSRLTAYLHRTWPAISPCPLAKDLSPVHPRRLYFYLTTTPHQPIPETVVEQPIPKPNRIISPSLSSASAADEEENNHRFTRDRHALSPSPEVDLSSPELDEDAADDDSPDALIGSYSSHRNSMTRDNRSYSHSRRAASPPLEHEERDFKQTASALYEQALARRSSQESQHDVNMESDTAAGAEQEVDSISKSIEALDNESEESVALKNREAAAALFESEAAYLRLEPNKSVGIMDFSSPMLRPQGQEPSRTSAKMEVEQTKQADQDMMFLPDAAMSSWDLQSPECIELEELEDMFDAY
jgi:hypothetical protein